MHDLCLVLKGDASTRSGPGQCTRRLMCPCCWHWDNWMPGREPAQYVSFVLSLCSSHLTMMRITTSGLSDVDMATRLRENPNVEKLKSSTCACCRGIRGHHSQVVATINSHAEKAMQTPCHRTLPRFVDACESEAERAKPHATADWHRGSARRSAAANGLHRQGT